MHFVSIWCTTLGALVNLKGSQGLDDLRGQVPKSAGHIVLVGSPVPLGAVGSAELAVGQGVLRSVGAASVLRLVRLRHHATAAVAHSPGRRSAPGPEGASSPCHPSLFWTGFRSVQGRELLGQATKPVALSVQVSGGSLEDASVPPLAVLSSLRKHVHPSSVPSGCPFLPSPAIKKALGNIGDASVPPLAVLSSLKKHAPPRFWPAFLAIFCNSKPWKALGMRLSPVWPSFPSLNINEKKASGSLGDASAPPPLAVLSSLKRVRSPFWPAFLSLKSNSKPWEALGTRLSPVWPSFPSLNSNQKALGSIGDVSVPPLAALSLFKSYSKLWAALGIRLSPLRRPVFFKKQAVGSRGDASVPPPAVLSFLKPIMSFEKFVPLMGSLGDASVPPLAVLSSLQSISKFWGRVCPPSGRPFVP